MSSEVASAVLPGFDPKYRDFPDYIIKITKEIWEDRGIETLHHYYAEDTVVRSPSGVVVGNEAVIMATMSTLAEFSDLELFAEDVIWSGSAEEGFLSSHRVLAQATHSVDGVCGKASGKRLCFREIAECHAARNRIDDEWLIRDQSAIAAQLGMSAEAYTRKGIEAEGGFESCSRPFGPESDRIGVYRGRGNENEWGQNYAELVRRIMRADFAAIPQTYDRGCHLEYPGGQTAHGWGAADRFWLSLRSSFPDAVWTVEHQIGRDEDPLLPPRAALRWSLYGKHSGWGRFGRPSGAMVYVMGMSHAEFGPWGLRREYVLFDETAVWKQILLACG